MNLSNNLGRLYVFLENLEPTLSGKQQELETFGERQFPETRKWEKKKQVTGSSTEEGFAQGLDLLVQPKIQ